MTKRTNPQAGKLSEEAQAVLDRRRYTADVPLLRDLADSFEYNHAKIMRKVLTYKAVGFFLLLAIPVLSTLIAFEVNVPPGTQPKPAIPLLEGSVPILSLALVLLTVLNSCLKPAVRFDRSCRVGLDLFHWRQALLEGLDKLDPLNHDTLVKYLTEERKSLRKIQEAQIDLALPDQT